MTPPTPRYLVRENGERVAYVQVPGTAPTVVFLGGYASDMTGTKASHLDAWARARGRAFVRFDYRGHGASGGRFADGTIGGWRDDALLVIRTVTEGPLVLVGSSMGAWIMLLCALVAPERVRGLVGVAAAPDFTEDLIWARLGEVERAAFRRDGVLDLPAEPGAVPHPVTWPFVEEGRRHLVLRSRIDVRCPVRLLHGTADGDVPWETSRRLLEVLATRDATLTLVKDGGHRLSEPRDLALLTATVAALS